jgi:glycoprotein 6-alpha-L-fucosyltransferase
MKALLGRGSTLWVFGVLAAVLVCNMLLLHYMQQGSGENERDMAEVRQAQRVASSLRQENEALQLRLRHLTRERDALRSSSSSSSSIDAEEAEKKRDGSWSEASELEAVLEDIKERSGDLAKELQRRASEALHRYIGHIQNPPSCAADSPAQFMVCPVVDSCGFGCALHHLTYCFIAALRDNRTVVLEDDAINWPYARGCKEEGRREGWECFSQPISSCHHSDLRSWTGHRALPDWKYGSPEKVTTVRFWSRPDRGINFLPWASTDGDQTNDPFYMPQVAKDVLALVPHGEIGDLRAWLVGHIQKYLLRPNVQTARALREIHANLARVAGSHEQSAVGQASGDQVGDWWKADWELPHDQRTTYSDGNGDQQQPLGEWRHPIAGMHVRRTDHGSEAPFREVHEYMARIEAWWNDYRSHPDHPYVSSRLRVYLATDEPKVIEEAGRSYPQFVFLTTSHGGRASGEGERQGTVHTQNLLSDLFHLAKCDFFVGTASSQVTRMAYERQQTHSLDRHNWRAFVSLDAPWYFP